MRIRRQALEGADEASRHAASRLSACRRAETSAADDVGRHRDRDPTPSRRGDAGRKIQLEDDRRRKPGKRRLDRVPRMPDDDRHRPGAGRQRGLDHAADDRSARDLGHELGRPRAAGGAVTREDRPAASTTAPILVMRLAGLGPGGDLHQQPADFHGADVGVGDGHAGKHPLQDPVEAVFLRRSGAAGRADDRLLRRGRRARRLPGSTGCRNVRSGRRTPRSGAGRNRAGRRSEAPKRGARRARSRRASASPALSPGRARDSSTTRRRPRAAPRAL